MNKPPKPWETAFQLAWLQASSAQFEAFLESCKNISEIYRTDDEALIEVGRLLVDFGFLSRARWCFETVSHRNREDMRAELHLANLALIEGDHINAQKKYKALQLVLPENSIIKRNLLLSQQYDPTLSYEDRLKSARSWGKWAISRAGGIKTRPAKRRITASESMPLKIGYVSSDFCQHTVGLFVKNIIQQHSRNLIANEGNSVEVFVYSSGRISDWVTEEIKRYSKFKDVSSLDDKSLVDIIQKDKIDLLVDLSGHTAGSRLTAFAYRAAPVQVSWLGYFATTGLSYIDAVLLDKWHAPLGTEIQFTEEIFHLHNGRLNYQPVPWAPEVSPAPCLKNGFITFGCFNNTSKLNSGVFDVWSSVLQAVPNSRLILKWRTFADEKFSNSIFDTFAHIGIDPNRIELRKASFHADLLQEYQHLDIALDPFPFTGGLTSCESLWMGVPIVTLPQQNVVSRQTYAILNAIGFPDWAATTTAQYISIAKLLASNPEQLQSFRDSLRNHMRSSALMDTIKFTQELEAAFHDIYHKFSQ